MEEKAKKIIAEQLGIEENTIKMNSSFINDLEADSLDFVELIMAMETEFGVSIDESETENIKTVQDLIDYLKNKGC